DEIVRVLDKVQDGGMLHLPHPPHLPHLPYLPYLGAIYCRMNATRYEVRGLGCHKKTPNSVELGVLQKLKPTALEAHSLALGGRRSREF
ncbi:MAG: hypothetical protein ICV55_02955, partial [Coleofasciculus sp. C3-bin4]|nr:hypothetical protein [Coleofasciculus sp. C3-bin4]